MKKFTRRSFLFNAGATVSATTAAIALPSLFTPNNIKLYDGRKLNIALCGLGNYAGYLAEGLEVSQYCRLAGIVTGHPAKAETWKKKYNIPDKNIYNYQNFDEIKNNPDIDLVYVVLPNFMHKEYTVRAAKASKHVICEKPMAISVEDCEEMIKACKDAGVQLAIGYRLHYEPYNLEMKRLGQEKVFGQVRLVEASLGYRTYDFADKAETGFDINDDTQWRLNKYKAGGGPLINLGIYCIQCCRYILGKEPVSVTAQFGKINNKIRFAQVEETITWQMEFPNAIITNCTSSYAFGIDRFFASADDGWFELSPAISYGPFRGRTSKAELSFPDINQQAAQLDGIGKLILDNKPLPDHITGEEGIKDVRIIQAIYKAAATGNKVMLI
ncbi:MAG: Gfo/Idh/MocA family oxidoreductase [Parafilimonas sp.]